MVEVALALQAHLRRGLVVGVEQRDDDLLGPQQQHADLVFDDRVDEALEAGDAGLGHLARQPTAHGSGTP